MFINSNKIVIDSIMNFSQNEDLLRMENGNLEFRFNYLYLFMTKFLIDFEKELIINMAKQAAY